MKGWLVGVLLALAACGEGESVKAAVDAGPQPTDVHAAPKDYDAAGPFSVGVVNFAAKDPARDRTVHFSLWYPLKDKLAVEPLAVPQQFYTGDQQAALQNVYAKADDACVHISGESVPGDHAISPGLWPVVVFSHCSGCFRAASFSLAERLASHGIAVIAPDHPPNTVFDELAGKAEGVTTPMLDTRAADVKFALDLVLDATTTAVPAPVRGHFDPARVGCFGHSFGAITTGRVLRDDGRVKAGVGIAAPFFLAADAMKDIHKPVALILAQEDASVGALGIQLQQLNYDNAPGPAWLFSVADAGHFTFSDVANLREAWSGCGPGKRLDDDAPFTYLDPAKGRHVAMRIVTAFFARYLRDEPAATQAFDLPWPATVTVQHKP